MEIGLSSAVFYPNVKTEDSIKLISKLGFKCAEIFLNSPTEYDTDYIKKLVELKEKHGLNINSVHSFSSSFEPYLFDLYERRRKDMLKHFIKVCRAGSALGANCYTFHGMKLENINFINKKLIYEVYDNLLYIAGENGIKLAQENVSWCMSSSKEYLEGIKEHSKYPLYFTLDIKQAYKASKEPTDYLEVMKDSLINFHINDRDNKNVCLLPGKGDVDYEKVFAQIEKVNYSGNAIMEIYSYNYSTYEELVKSKNL